MKDVVIRKSIILSAIAAICIIAGTAYGIVIKDKIIVVMSFIICTVNIYKVFELNRIEKDHNYIVISGKCERMGYKLIGRYRIAQIQTDDGVLEISLPPNVKLKTDEVYNFYFRKSITELNACSAWLKNKILSETFIGCEIINRDKRIGEENLNIDTKTL